MESISSVGRCLCGRHRRRIPGGTGCENFTVTGLTDDDVCIGDRYCIGSSEFEVAQPRVTCFRIGLRLNEPEMPNLLVSRRRPGFYFRVITEGQVRTGDDIVRTRRGRHELSVADVDALLYLPNHNIEHLRKAVEIPALSPGWQQSFQDMLKAHEQPEAQTPPTRAEPVWNGFRPLRVSAIRRESPQVMSIRLEADDHCALPPALPGQYLTVRVKGAGEPTPLRSYSLSGDPDAGEYRISVKREDHGLASQWLHAHIKPGSFVEAAAPRGDFYLTEGSNPVVLVSAGIGITAVLAMLHTLSTAHSSRDRVAATRSAAGVLHASTGPSGSGDDRSGGPAGRCCGIPLWPDPIHVRHARCPHRGGTRPRADPQRIIRCPTADQSGHRRRRTT